MFAWVTDGMFDSLFEGMNPAYNNLLPTCSAVRQR